MEIGLAKIFLAYPAALWYSLGGTVSGSPSDYWESRRTSLNLRAAVIVNIGNFALCSGFTRLPGFVVLQATRTRGTRQC